MNGKIGMRAFSILLTGLLVSVVVVSMASAQTSMDAIAEEELADSVIITPDFSSQDIVVSPSLGEDDLITLVFPESWIKDRNSADYADRIELADAQVLLFYECVDCLGQDHHIPRV